MATRTAPRTPSSPHGTHAWLAVVRAYNLCDAVMTARLAELGLRVGEHEVLANLATSPGMTQQELAARCFVAKSGVSMLLAQMEAQGLVLREADAGDARVKRLLLTANGRALAATSMRVQADVIGAMAKGTSEAELATVAEVMRRVSDRLQALRSVRPAGRSPGTRAARPAPTVKPARPAAR